MMAAAKVIYICSPYRGDVRANEMLARRAMLMALLDGYAPVVPHLLYPSVLNDDDAEERRLGTAAAMNLIDICSAVWVIGDKISEGMRAEMTHAAALCKDFRFVSMEEILKINHTKLMAAKESYGC